MRLCNRHVSIGARVTTAFLFAFDSAHVNLRYHRVREPWKDRLTWFGSARIRDCRRLSRERLTRSKEAGAHSNTQKPMGVPIGEGEPIGWCPGPSPSPATNSLDGEPRHTGQAEIKAMP